MYVCMYVCMYVIHVTRFLYYIVEYIFDIIDQTDRQTGFCLLVWGSFLEIRIDPREYVFSFILRILLLGYHNYFRTQFCFTVYEI